MFCLSCILVNKLVFVSRGPKVEACFYLYSDKILLDLRESSIVSCRLGQSASTNCLYRQPSHGQANHMYLGLLNG